MNIVKSNSKRNATLQNRTSIDIDKKALEEVLVQVVETMVKRSEKQMDTEEKIITEYIEETDEEEFGIFKKNLRENIEKIKLGIANNKILIISELEGKVYLPYTIDELEEYMRSYPADYKTIEDVVRREFIVDYKKFFEEPAKSRFLETYTLIRNREGKSFIVSVLYALKMMFYKNINAAIIASCKNEIELNNYLYFLKSKRTDLFEHFKIVYDMVPKK